MKDPARIFAEGTEIDAGIRASLRQVRILHKKMGVPLVGMKDGKIVTVQPEDIRIETPPDPK